MTSEEEVIKTLKGEAWICCAEKWNEALDMANKALKRDNKIRDILNKDCTDITKFVLIRQLYEDKSESE